MITMDWVPTLLAAAGTQPDPAYPSDGEDLLPVLTGTRAAASAQAVLALQGRIAARRPRRRLEISADRRQRVSVRRGQDPRERANLKDRHKDIFDRLKSDWETWNDSMLPERPRPATYTHPGNLLADHYGAGEPTAPSRTEQSPQELSIHWNAWLAEMAGNHHIRL